jgi:zinc protease
MARVFALLRLAVAEARLDQASIERVVGQISASLRREANDPDFVAGRNFRALAYPDHPYGRPVRGTLATLPTLSPASLRDLRASMFARDKLKISVVGAIDAATLSGHLDDVFGQLPEKSALAPVPHASFCGLGSRHVMTIDLPQSTIHFGRQGLARKDPDFTAAMVINHILGGGIFSARLFREVREKRGLAYSVYSHLATNDHAALFIGSTSTKNERACESLAVIEKEVVCLSERGPTQDELEKAKKYLIGSYPLRFDTSTKIASQLNALQLEDFGVEYLDERNRLIASVTMEDAKRAAKRLLGDGQLLVVVAGRPEGM